MTGPELAAAALRYAGFGWAVLPFHWPPAPGQCSCGCEDARCSRRGKHPLLPFDQATTRSAEVRTWWERWPEASIFVAARASGLLVLDIDHKPSAGAGKALGDAVQRYGPTVLDTLRARSGGGGWHVFFEVPPGAFPLRKRPRATRAFASTQGAIVWPSAHVSGAHYRWHGCAGPWERRPLLAPERLLRDLAPSPGAGWYARNLPGVASHYAQAIARTARPLRRRRR